MKDDRPYTTAETVLGFIVIAGYVVFSPFIIAWKIYSTWKNSPRQQEKEATQAVQHVYQTARSIPEERRLPRTPDFAERVVNAALRAYTAPRYPFVPPSTVLITTMLDMVSEIYEIEFPDFGPPPPIANSIEGARYRDYMSAQLAKATNPHILKLMEEPLVKGLTYYLNKLPPAAFIMDEEDIDALVSVPIGSVIKDVPHAMEGLFIFIFGEEQKKLGLFKDVRNQLNRNVHDVSGVSFIPENEDHPKLVYPREYKGDGDLPSIYLRDTPFERLFQFPVPLELPQQTRFEHQWIVAGTGHGKTQTLQYLISRDLHRVRRGEASIVLIDSQGDMIRTISHLGIFAEEEMQEKLVLIDPADIEWPVQLNMFALGSERMQTYSPLERERLQNAAIELLEFIMASLLGQEMTGKQSSLFRYALRALVTVIPDPTIHTFRELMQPDGYTKFKPHLDKLTGTTKAFFDTEFQSAQFRETKQQVVRRLFAVLESQVWERMFAASKSKLDLFAEMGAGKVILISTDKSLMRQTGTEVLGRFFVSLIAMATLERQTSGKKLPCFVYIDEANDYFGGSSGDANLEFLLEQSRKQNVGLVLSHQYIDQMPAKIVQSLSANTSIKFFGGVSAKDSRTAAPMLRCTPAFIEDQPKGTFAAFVKGQTDSAIPFSVPFGILENQPKMSDEEYAAVRQRSREKHAIHYAQFGAEPAELPLTPELPAADPTPAAPEPAPPAPADQDTPSAEWTR